MGKDKLPEQTQMQYDSLLTRTKHTLYETLYALLVENQSASILIYRVLVVVEGLQMLSFLLNPVLGIYQSDVMLLNIIQIILQFINFQSDAAQNQGTAAICIAIGLSITLLLAAAIGYAACTAQDKQNAGLSPMRLINLSILVMQKTLTIPLLSISVSTINCTVRGTCSGVNYMILTALSFTIVFLVIIFNIVYGLCYYIKFPLSGCYLAKQNNYDQLSKLLLKIAPIVYYSIDPSFQYIFIFIFGITILAVGYIALFRVLSISYYNQTHEFFILFIQIFFVFQCMNACANVVLNNSIQFGYYSYVYSLGCSGLMGLAVCRLKKWLQLYLMSRFIMGEGKKQNYQRFYFILLNYIWHQSMQESMAKSAFYAAYFKCLKYQLNQSENNAIKIKQTTKSNIKIKSKSKSKNKQQTRSTFASKTIIINQLYLQSQKITHLQDLTEWILLENPSHLIKIIKCYIDMDNGKVSAAIHSAIELSYQKIDFSLKFLLFYFHKKYNPYIKLFQEEIKREKDDNNLIICFQLNERTMYFQKLVKEYTQKCIDYWEQLCEQESSVAKILNISKELISLSKEIKQTYSQIEQLEHLNIHSTNIYLKFLSDVSQDVNQIQRIKQAFTVQAQKHIKYSQIFTQVRSQGQIQRVILAIDTIGDGIGTILNCNQTVRSLLKYEKSELIGKNINAIMPKRYALFHNDKIRQFIYKKNNHSTTVNDIFGLTQHQLVNHFDLQSQIICNHFEGLMMIGVLKNKQNQIQQIPSFICDLQTKKIKNVNAAFFAMVSKKLQVSAFTDELLLINYFLPQLVLQQLVQAKSLVSLFEIILEADALSEDKVREKRRRNSGSSNASNISKSNPSYNAKINELHKTKRNAAHDEIIFRQEMVVSIKCISKVGNSTQAYITLEDKQQFSEDYSQNQLNQVAGVPLALLFQQLTKPHLQIGNDENSGKLPLLHRSKKTIFIEPINRESDSKSAQFINKIYKFIQKNQEKTLKIQWQINYAIVLMVLVILTCSVISFLSILPLISNSNNLYQGIKASYDMISNEGNIALYASKMINEGPTQDLSMIISNNTAQLMDNYHSMMHLLSNYPSKSIDINEHLPFVLGNGSILTMKYTDGLEVFILDAKEIANIKEGNVTAAAMAANANKDAYMQNAAKSLLPQQLQITASGYSQSFKASTFQYSINQLILYLTRWTIYTVFFIVIFIMASLINDFVFKVILIYNAIRVWDVAEITRKCTFFLRYFHFINYARKKRSASILKIFPFQEIVKLTKQPQPQLNIILNNNQSPTNTPQSQSISKQIIQKQDIQHQKQVLLPGESPPNNIHCKIDNSLKRQKQIFFTASAVILFISLIFFGVAFTLHKDLNTSIQNIIQVQKVRKNIKYMLYYSYQTLLYANQLNQSQFSSYYTSFQLQVGEFYSNSQNSFNLFSNPPILLNIYSSIQQIEQLLQSNYNVTPSNSAYTYLQSNFQQADTIIQQLLSSTYDQQMQDILTGGYSVLVGKLVLDIGVVLIIYGIIKKYVINKIIAITKNTICMMKLIPMWLVQRNSCIQKIILNEQ